MSNRIITNRHLTLRTNHKMFALTASQNNKVKSTKIHLHIDRIYIFVQRKKHAQTAKKKQTPANEIHGKSTMNGSLHQEITTRRNETLKS